MKLAYLKRRLKYIWLFFPIQVNGILFLLMLGVLILIIRDQYSPDDSLNQSYLEFFAWLGGAFVLIVLALGWIYALVCYLYFLIKRNKTKVNLNIGLEDGQKGEVGKIPTHLSISRLWMPILGFVKARMVFKEDFLSGPVVLNRYSKGWKDLLPKEGTANIWLTDRKQYTVKGFLISFEDFMEFFRFSMFIPHKKSFYLPPVKADLPLEEVPPSKSYEEAERIKTSKRVEGDFFNYKDFESGDDVRRIVWKIFAKNHELVVRIPEIINPFASHVLFYASFHNGIRLAEDGNYSTGILNYYKDIVYNICLSVERSDRKIMFRLDQPVLNGIAVEKADMLAYQLSCARWQTETSINELHIQNAEAIVCVSSLTPAEELGELIKKGKINVFIVKISKYLNDQNLFNWRNLFLRRDQKNEINKLSWLFSKTRKQIRENEKQIDELVADRNFQGQVI
ncbi:MAG TPA: DUF58 domain-containing protein [Cyclobacteriaceae bacterium]